MELFSQYQLFTFSFSILLLLNQIHVSSTTNLNSDGGYHIVVAVSDDVPDDVITNLTKYVENTKNMLDNFGKLLWEATDSTFFLKSVIILVPSSWSDELGADVSVTATYDKADIQISLGNEVPVVENYYPCGKPGVRIQLPFWFTDGSSDADLKYGSQVKGLLSLWLRYRFGVWEEHGYPHHNITPYVYDLNDADQSSSTWALTSCNDSSLRGEFKSISQNRGQNQLEMCNTIGMSAPMEKSCRFDPYVNGNVATTSLMNFQWVKSIDRLCNENSHDKLVPNRQNLYCSFKSIWEVIGSSTDFITLSGNSGSTVPEIEYHVAHNRIEKPGLYILLDISDPYRFTKEPIYDYWLAELTTFINELAEDVFVTLVIYPTGLPTSQIQAKVPWARLNSTTKSQIISALDFRPGLLFPDYDFRFPLAEAIMELKLHHQEHQAGSILLLLRTAHLYCEDFAILDGYVPGPFEEDFVADLTHYRIIMNVIDTYLVNRVCEIYLDYVTSKCGGSHGLIVRGMEESEVIITMKPVLDHVKKMLQQDHDDAPLITDEFGEMIYKEFFTQFDEKSILIPRRYTDFEILHVIVSIGGAKLDNISFEGLQDGFIERPEWHSGPLSQHYTPPSYSYSLRVKISDLEEAGSSSDNDVWAWELKMIMGTQYGKSVSGAITVYGHSMGTRVNNEPQPKLKVKVHTSADDSHVFGCFTEEMNEEPLGIYVVLQMEAASGGGRDRRPRPVFLRDPYYNSNEKSGSPSTLSALLVHTGTQVAVAVPLDDNGAGADLLAGDGVYSGYVYPHSPYPAAYRIFIIVYDVESNTSIQVQSTINPIGRLHSLTQDDLEVVVNGITLRTPYSFAMEANLPLWTIGDCSRKKHISRVTDTQVVVTDDPTIVTLSFKVPVLTQASHFTYEEDNELGSFYMGLARLSEDLDSMIKDEDHGALQVFLVPSLPAGRSEEVVLKREHAQAVSIQMLDFRDSPTKSRISNIARVVALRPEVLSSDDEPQGCYIGCTLVIGLASCGLIILTLLLISFMLWRKNLSQRALLLELSKDEIKEFLHGHRATPKRAQGMSVGPSGGYLEDCSELIQSLPYDSKYEIPNNKLHIDKTELLGSGAFGDVYKGYVVNLPGTKGKVLIVAVKTMKLNMDKSYFKALLLEVKLMTQIGDSHPNIIKLIGACTKNIRKCEVFLATEFCTNGNLLTWLQNLNDSNFKTEIPINETGYDALTADHNGDRKEIMTTWNLVKWSREIANGMEFLSRKKIIHGDLAARNILLDADLIAKVSDFGLSKQLVQYGYGKYGDGDDGGSAAEVEVEGLLPWKWLAPEALKFSKFSVATDVWAYGVTIWEIFSLGQIPYPGIKWSPDFVHQLEAAGHRLLKPNLAMDEIYEMMLKCWTLEPGKRPSFNELKSTLDQVMTGSKGCLGEYMDLLTSSEDKSNNP